MQFRHRGFDPIALIVTRNEFTLLPITRLLFLNILQLCTLAQAFNRDFSFK